MQIEYHGYADSIFRVIYITRVWIKCIIPFEFIGTIDPTLQLKLSSIKLHSGFLILW